VFVFHINKKYYRIIPGTGFERLYRNTVMISTMAHIQHRTFIETAFTS